MNFFLIQLSGASGKRAKSAEDENKGYNTFTSVKWVPAKKMHYHITFEKGCRNIERRIAEVHRTIPKGGLGYDQ